MRNAIGILAAGHRAELFHRPTAWNQKIGLLTEDREARRHDADNGPGHARCGQRHVEHVLTAAKTSLPEFVAQHDDRVTGVFFGRVRAAERRPDV